MSEQTGERKYPAPALGPENREYWQAAAEGRLVVKHCLECGRPHFYPRALCPHCGSARTEFREACGRGTIYAVSVTRNAGPQPFAMAYVALPEGVTMLTNIVDCELDALRVGDAVEVVFKPTDGGPPVPVFRPARE